MSLFSWGQLRRGIKQPLLLALALLLVLLLLSACAENGSDGAQDSKPKVVTTLAIFADFARQVSGDQVEVSTLVPSGADVHTYEPPPSRVAKLGDADMVVMNGLELEAPLESIIQENTPSSATIVELSQGLSVISDDEGHGGEDDGEGGNPHLWLDVQNAMSYVESIRDALVDVDPDSAEIYRSNAETYLTELRDLDEDVAAAVDSIPADMRKLVTFHDAYPYLARRYGLEVIAVVVPSPGQEPSAKDVEKLVDTIREQDVPAVFKEPQFSARILELAADDAGVEVCTLYSGALDDEVTSYVELMRFNAEEMVRCLR